MAGPDSLALLEAVTVQLTCHTGREGMSPAAHLAAMQVVTMLNADMLDQLPSNATGSGGFATVLQRRQQVPLWRPLVADDLDAAFDDIAVSIITARAALHPCGELNLRAASPSGKCTLTAASSATPQMLPQADNRHLDSIVILLAMRALRPIPFAGIGKHFNASAGSPQDAAAPLQLHDLGAVAALKRLCRTTGRPLQDNLKRRQQHKAAQHHLLYG